LLLLPMHPLLLLLLSWLLPVASLHPVFCVW
jgi:hypothetical protein